MTDIGIAYQYFTYCIREANRNGSRITQLTRVVVQFGKPQDVEKHLAEICVAALNVDA